MLSAIVRFALRFRGVVIALAAAFLGYGVYSLFQARYDVFPEFAPPQVQIQTGAPGLSPEQVEALVTQPIENVLNGLQGIESLRSGSIQGLSVITVIFQPSSEIFLDRQLVAERLAAVASSLPAGLGPPEMTPLTSSTSTVLAVGLTSSTRSLMELRTIADWTVRQRLLAVPGVAKVAVFGGDVRQLQVQVEPERLVRFGLAIEDIVAAARHATGVRGAGQVDTVNQRLVIHTEGQALTPAELADTVVARRGGAVVRLGDVAKVVDGAEPPVGAASIMGKPGVMLMVSSQYRVTGQVDRALAELRPTLDAQGVRLDADNILRPARFIATATGNVRSALLLGALLVVVVLSLFLFNLRTAAISCTAIPLSLLAAVTVLERLGISLNTMTLGGLAIAIGEVVDDAVIDVENILRRLRENRRREAPLPALRVIYDASIEVRSAVVYATFAVVLVFVPILTMSGVAGRLFAPLGMAYILAILASLVVALTVTPALCSLLLREDRLPEGEPPVVVWLRARYVPLLVRVERHPRVVITAVAVLTVGGLAMLPFFGGGFVPQLKEGHFVVHMTAVPGTSLAESLRMGGTLSKLLLALPEVRAVGQRVGRADAADDIMGTHSSEIEVDLKPLGGAASRRVEAKIRDVLHGFPGANFAVNTFLSERVEETLSGYGAPVAVNIFGSDLDVLDAKAAAVAAVLAKVPGAADVLVQSPPGSPQLVVRLRRAELARWGLDPVTALDAVRTAYQGQVVGQVYDAGKIFAAAVILDPALRADPGSVGALPLRNAEGTFVPLGRVADVFETTGRYSVLHEGARRVQAVTCSVVGRNVASFVADAKRRLAAAVPLPAGVYLDFAGSAAEQARSTRDLLVHAAIAGVGILILLSMVMGSARNFLLVLANLPFALVGGILVVLASGGDLSLGSLVGFVTVFGITLRNSIMLISHYEHLVGVEGEIWGPAAALRGAEERLAPILMTALVTGLGLLPLALGSGAPGREIEGPMALVILGGLVTSTALNLLVLPTLALRFGRFTGPDNRTAVPGT
ncbi:MAG: CusA/CzcA family heavy metal efflux RND transporter [Acidobacteria bacterium 37-71-11]|nr:MAG: CusA/CzcA family heavy metal efflux RND transporter [Acidobacteria bacterium 37-71-11]